MYYVEAFVLTGERVWKSEPQATKEAAEKLKGNMRIVADPRSNQVIGLQYKITQSSR